MIIKIKIIIIIINFISRGYICVHCYFLLYKIEWFIDFPATNYLTCVIIHDNLTCVDYRDI